MKKLHFVAATATALLGASPAWVHHSGAMFDPAKTTTITGSVTEFNWTNPHSSFKVSVTGADGKDEIWAIEMNSPGNLVRSGWKRSTIKSGDKVTVQIHPLRDGQPGGQYVSIKLADGTVLNAGPAEGPGYGPAPAASP